MNITVGVEGKDLPIIFDNIKAVSDGVNAAVPGLGHTLSVKSGMTADHALIILSQQISEILMSHANLEILFMEQGEDFQQSTDDFLLLKEEYERLKSMYDASEKAFHTMVQMLSQTPENNADFLNDALVSLTEYSCDDDVIGINKTWTFNENDLRRGLADAIHSFNIKVINS
jgi:hypothetical protein